MKCAQQLRHRYGLCLSFAVSFMCDETLFMVRPAPALSVQSVAPFSRCYVTAGKRNMCVSIWEKVLSVEWGGWKNGHPKEVSLFHAQHLHVRYQLQILSLLWGDALHCALAFLLGAFPFHIFKRLSSIFSEAVAVIGEHTWLPQWPVVSAWNNK